MSSLLRKYWEMCQEMGQCRRWGEGLVAFPSLACEWWGWWGRSRLCSSVYLLMQPVCPSEPLKSLPRPSSLQLQLSLGVRGGLVPGPPTRQIPESTGAQVPYVKCCRTACPPHPAHGSCVRRFGGRVCFPVCLPHRLSTPSVDSDLLSFYFTFKFQLF